MTNLRMTAALVLQDTIEKGYSLTDSLPLAAEKFKDPRDRALLQALCFGVCRWYFRLDRILQQLLQKPLKNKDQDIYALLLVGLYQLIFMRIPAYAAIGETVEATKSLKKIWAKSFVNGVLREYQRREKDFDSLDYSHPEWMIKKIKQDFPNDWEKILEANNQHPPFSLRVNQQRISRVNYLEKLQAEGIAAEIIQNTQSGIILREPIDVGLLPGFKKGDVSVQDGAAQMAAELLELEPKQRVLDGCAAPGGKTSHILECEPTVDCIAVDQDPVRLDSVKENLQRLHLTAKCIVADLANISAWWDGKLFDRILLDAPCSATGVIRRHPDIKLLRRESDIVKLAEVQCKLLDKVWELLKPNGKILYVTCSIFAEENVQVVQKFTANHPDAVEEKILQILPGMQGMDGFFFARLRKSVA